MQAVRDIAVCNKIVYSSNSVKQLQEMILKIALLCTVSPKLRYASKHYCVVSEGKGQQYWGLTRVLGNPGCWTFHSLLQNQQR